MKAKKIWALVLVICMVFASAACGSSSRDDDDDDRSSRKTARDKEGDNDKDEAGLLPGLADLGKDDGKKDDRDDRDDGEGRSDRDNREDKDTLSGRDDWDDQDTGSDTEPGVVYEDSDVTIHKAQLPEGYPEDKFPFMEGTTIEGSYRDNSRPTASFAVFCSVSAPFDEVSAYYANFLAQNATWEAQSAPGIDYFKGTCFGYEFQIQIVADTTSDEKTSVTIILEEAMSADAALAELDVYNLPTGYPEDLFPIIDNHAISHSTKSVYRDETTEQSSYHLEIYTTHTLDEVLAFYEEVLGDISDMDLMTDEISFDFSGHANGYDFDIRANKEVVDGAELIYYTLDLQYTSDN